MGTPQDWAPYPSVEDAAKVYLRDPDLALDQLRSIVDLPTVKSFIMSRGFTEESWGETDENRLWQEVVLTDGRRLIMWRADDVPEPVAVDEAVELAKRLSTDDSPGFVNGVLGQIMLVTPQIRAAAQAVRGSSEGT